LTTTPTRRDSDAVTREVALDSRDHRLIDMLVAGHTQQQCADALGCNRRTVGRRAQRPAFTYALAQAEAEVRRTARRKIAASLTTAADYLARAVEDDDVPPAVRVQAAGRLLAAWAALEPHRLDVAATVAAAPQPDRPARDVLNDALDRARERLGLDEPALSGNGASDGH
jgi:hypothetical protein